MQKGRFLPSAETYLDVGRHTSGVVYFEHILDSLGVVRPREHRNRIRMKVRVRDSFGKTHSNKVWVRVVDLDEARRYCASFGKTLASMRGECLPYDEAREAADTAS